MDRGKLPRWVGVVAAVVVAGCTTTAETTTTSRPDTTTSTVLVTTTTIQATTTTEASTTTTQPESYVPEPPEKLISNFNRQSVDDFDTTGDDLYRVVVEHDALYAFLEGSPTGTAEEMVYQLFDPNYEHVGIQLDGFGELAANEWHYVDPGAQLLGVRVLEVRGNEAIVTLADRRGQQILHDNSGTEVKRYLGWEPEITTLLFIRTDKDAPWRIAKLIDGPLPATQEDLAELVPVTWTGR